MNQRGKEEGMLGLKLKSASWVDKPTLKDSSRIVRETIKANPKFNLGTIIYF